MAEYSEIIHVTLDLNKERSEIISALMTDDSFAALDMNDQKTLVIEHWNSAMISFILCVWQLDYLDFAPKDPPPVLELCAGSAAALADDDKPIIESILTELVPEMMHLGLKITDLNCLYMSEVYDPYKLASKLNDLAAVTNTKAKAYRDYADLYAQDPIRLRNFHTFRQKVRALSGQCKKRLLWDDDEASMMTWLEEELKKRGD